MTKTLRRRCVWCGERFAVAGGPGRPSKYCRRSHRQRAYESRRIATERGIASDEVLLTRESWTQIRDCVYIAEAAARDAEIDLEDHPTKAELVSIVESLIRAIDAAAGVNPEPKAIGDFDS